MQVEVVENYSKNSQSLYAYRLFPVCVYVCAIKKETIKETREKESDVGMSA